MLIQLPIEPFTASPSTTNFSKAALTGFQTFSSTSFSSEWRRTRTEKYRSGARKKSGSRRMALFHDLKRDGQSQAPQCQVFHRQCRHTLRHPAVDPQTEVRKPLLSKPDASCGSSLRPLSTSLCSSQLRNLLQSLAAIFQKQRTPLTFYLHSKKDTGSTSPLSKI